MSKTKKVKRWVLIGKTMRDDRTRVNIGLWNTKKQALDGTEAWYYKQVVPVMVDKDKVE